MAPPILTVNHKEYAFWVLYEGLGAKHTVDRAKDDTLRLLKKFISKSKSQPRGKAKAKVKSALEEVPEEATIAEG